MHKTVNRPRSLKHWVHRFQRFWDIRQKPGIIGTLGRAYGIDQSRWEPRFYFDRAQSGLIDFHIIKATQDDQWKDPAFEQLYIDQKDVLVRGTFHYLSSGISGIRQADHFLRVIASKSFHILAGDFESIDNTMSDDFVRQTYEFLKAVRAARRQARVMLYTNPNLYDTWIYPAAMRIWGRDVFLEFDLWIAQYPWTINLDGQPAMPKNRKDWAIWQFSDAGDPIMHGTDGHVDRNIFNGTMAGLTAWAGAVESDQVSSPFTGATTWSGSRYGWDFALDIIEPQRMGGFRVVHPQSSGLRATVSSMAKAYDADLAFNGGDWSAKVLPFKPIDYAVHDGIVYVPDTGLGRPSLLVARDGSVRIDHVNKAGAWQALTGVRYIVRDGKPPTYLDGTEPQYTEGHARTCYGLDAAGRLMIWTNDGLYPNMGMTLKQVSIEMIKRGAIIAFDSGGGGDTTRVLFGEVTNIPQDGEERLLPEHFLIFKKETNMPIGNYEVISTTHELSLRMLHQVVGATALLKIPKGTLLTASEIWIAPETTSVNQKDDVWALVAYGGQTGWVALVHFGTVYGSYKLINEPVPPAAGKTYTVTIDVEGYKPITLTGTLESLG